MNHHPDIDIRWNTVTLRLTTHSEGGLTELDLELARASTPCRLRVAERRSGPTPFHYVPAGLLDGRPHVIVDGAPRPGTVGTLSHWPGHAHPGGAVARPLRRDRPACTGAVPAPSHAVSTSVTIDHYDADGVIALALLCVEGLADAHGPLLVEAARVGDFDVVTDHQAALVAFAVNALHDVERAATVLGVPVPDGDALDRTAWSATQALDLLPALVEDPERFRALWQEEAAAYDAATRTLVEGGASIEERPEHDLAIVRVDVDAPDAQAASWGGAPLHPAAVHSITDLLRVATIAGGAVEVRYRYESWVRLAQPTATSSRRPRGRGGRAHQERGRCGPLGLRRCGCHHGCLHLAGGGASTLDPEDVVDLVCQRLEILDAGPAAWDPYAAPTRRG